VAADPEVANLRSLGAFRKAGFTEVRTVRLDGELFERRVVHLLR
jgi:RimJ/RimL family protein N-acetyltransferase